MSPDFLSNSSTSSSTATEEPASPIQSSLNMQLAGLFYSPDLIALVRLKRQLANGLPA
ncbi:MAG: hypothetical protein Q8S00_23110 [Deltaproteobacteria bacterium]|nr:hypothetical protein [Deltaproteobacteria bacterium]